MESKIKELEDKIKFLEQRILYLESKPTYIPNPISLGPTLPDIWNNYGEPPICSNLSARMAERRNASTGG